MATDGRTHEADDLQFREDFHNWYFGEDAGGMFLTQAAKDLLMTLQNELETAAKGEKETGTTLDSPLTEDEQLALYKAASDLRHQLTWDLGAAQPPRLRWFRLGPTIAPPSRQEQRPDSHPVPAGQ